MVQQTSQISSLPIQHQCCYCHLSTFGYTCSSYFWLVFYSEASCHITRESSKFFQLTKVYTPSNLLTDGSSSSILGQGVVHPIPSSPFKHISILYVPKFPINLLSVSQLTKQFNCVAIFFASHYAFQDIHTKRMIGGGLRPDGPYYLDGQSIFQSHGRKMSNVAAIFSFVTPF